jgi:micrococcal nuclease
MYNYKAIVTRVVDGDTFDATVDLGFGVFKKHRFRLKDVDTPETWRPKTKAEDIHGEAATAFVTTLIEGQNVILSSVKSAVYSRYEAYVTLSDGSDLGTLIVENGFEKLDKYEDIDDTV